MRSAYCRVVQGLFVTMVGLVIAGPWLTAQAARLFGMLSPGSSALLASRRLADSPKAAFRSVTGLVLAVFLGTMVGTLVPAVNATEATPTAGALSNVLLDQLGLSPQAGAMLLSGLGGIQGATVYPLYSLQPGSRGVKIAPGAGGSGPGGGPGGGPGPAGKGSGAGNVPVTGGQGPGGQGPGGQGPGSVAVSCSVMRDLAVLGLCAPGAKVVQTDDGSLFDDNPMYNTQAFVSSSDPAYTGDLTKLGLQAVMGRVSSPATLERVRTFLATHTPPQVSAGQGSAPTPPRTFGETLEIRLGRAATLEKIVYAAVALTLIVAGCSLAVAVGGGLVDRKRPFTLLRVSGTPLGVLSRLAPAGTAIPQLGRDYYTIMGIGLAVAFGVIAVTLPLLRRMTAPGNVRFE